MCYRCMMQHLRYRLANDVDIELLESAIAQYYNISNFAELSRCDRIPHQNDDTFLQHVNNLIEVLTNFGFQFNDEEDDDEEMPEIDISNILNALRTMIGGNPVDSLYTSDPIDYVSLLVKLKTETEIDEFIKKITTIATAPLSQTQLSWYKRFLQEIPFDYTYRIMVNGLTIKLLHLSPGDITRKVDQIGEIVSKSFKLSSEIDGVCSICQTDLVDCCQKLDDKYLSCELKCGHKYCYPCFQGFQSTLNGDNCAVCREVIFASK